MQAELIEKRKQKKLEMKQNGEIDSSQFEEDKDPCEENDADNSFYSALYGDTSGLNPDPIISDVLTCLNSHSDLKKQFKRFLPEDDEEIQQLENNVQLLKQYTYHSNEELPMGAELDRSHDETANIPKLKRDAYNNLFKLLE